MRKTYFLALLLIPALLFARIVTITRIVDGDTFVTNKGEKIRLLWVDAPEKNQPYGPNATRHAEEKLKNRRVKLSNESTDIYRRTLAIISVDGEDLAESLLAEGLAWVWLAPSSELWQKKNLELREKLQAIEKEARENKKGLWSGKNPIEPWIFRKEN